MAPRDKEKVMFFHSITVTIQQETTTSLNRMDKKVNIDFGQRGFLLLDPRSSHIMRDFPSLNKAKIQSHDLTVCELIVLFF